MVHYVAAAHRWNSTDCWWSHGQSYVRQVSRVVLFCIGTHLLDATAVECITFSILNLVCSCEGLHLRKRDNSVGAGSLGANDQSRHCTCQPGLREQMGIGQLNMWYAELCSF